MSNSVQLYTNIAAPQSSFSFPFSYLEAVDITAYVDGVVVFQNNASTGTAVGGNTYVVAFSAPNSTTLTFSPAVVAGSDVRIQRNTDLTTKAVDFADGAVLTEIALDTAIDQVFFGSQEAIDKANESITVDLDDKWDANNKPIKNVANPVNLQDAATKNYIENTWLTTSDKAQLNSLNIANLNSVATNITDVNTVADNLSGITAFAAVYSSGPNDPTTGLNEGDLFFNTTSNKFKIYNGSSWRDASALDFYSETAFNAPSNPNSLSLGFGAGPFTSKGIALGGSDATVKISGAYTLPKTDGTNGQVLTTDGSGAVSFDDVSTAGALPLAGGTMTGNLTLSGTTKAIFGTDDLEIFNQGSPGFVNKITSTNGNNITLDTTGNVIIQGATAKFQGPTGDNGITFTDGGGVSVFHNDVQKLNTEASGINIDGNLTLTGNVDGRDIAQNIPSSLGTAGQVLTVNSGATATEWASSGSGDLLAANNLSDVSDASTSRTNLGVAIGSDVQAHSSVLDGTTASFTTAKDSKLTGIEAGATADQTGAEIKTAYEAEANAFTDAQFTKLAGIEAGADVTDTANVTAAGALMDSEVTNLAQVKAFDSSDYATAAQGATADAALGSLVEDTSPQLGGDLSVNGKSIVSTTNSPINLDAAGTGKVTFKGNATRGSGQFVLNSETNVYGITIKGPPHSAAASYTLTLPDTDGSASEFLQTDGSGNLTWAAVAAGGDPDLYRDNAVGATTPSATGTNSVAINNLSQASGTNSIALGSASISSATSSTAFTNSNASGSNSIAGAIGNNSTGYGAKNTGTVAFGYTANSSGSHAISIGYQATAAGNYATCIGRGGSTTAEGASSLGGRSGLATGIYSTTVGGRSNKAYADYAVAMGYWTYADKIGQNAFASGRFNDDGDAQTSKFVLRSDTTDATPEALTTNNSTASTNNQIILGNNSAYSFSGTIIAREDATDGSDYASWEIKGALLRDANAASTVLGNGIQNKLYATAGASAWAIALTADTTNGGLKIEVTGAAATSIKWVCSVDTSEVIYN
jgi:hypothetical protein